MPETGNRIQVAIEDEMRSSYIDYAMSVIVGRALPDVRDGLKPVHRRILYSMQEMGVTWNRPYRKSARVVGEVIGKYHPHGDAAVYDALARMAQDFSMRYPLVDGQGNFGSVDGDPPAAMRYTEVRMARIAEELLVDIDQDTVEFLPNYDGSLQEPQVLPSRLPNLLVNGSSGIAVGMATNIPPHNLNEVVDALIHLIEHPDTPVERLLDFIPGPDFPTGGVIWGTRGIQEAYTSGRGVIQVRARAHIEPLGRGDRESIVITEIPFGVNKARLIERIAELVRDRKIEGITEIRDESDREGIRVVLELRKGENARILLNQLYKHTQMQDSFGVILLALVHNQPRLLNLKEMLTLFLDHRKEVVVRRTRYELGKARERIHILEGLLVALAHLDEVIAMIRASASPDAARQALVARFPLTETQAQAILDMRLQRLTALEREKIESEHRELQERIACLQSVLETPALVLRIIREELEALKRQYGDARRTQILHQAKDLEEEDLIVREPVVVTISHSGYVKRASLDQYRSQHRGGRGKTGMETREEDFVQDLFVGTTHDTLLCFTDAGRVYWLKVHQIPEAGRHTRGRSLMNLLSLGPEERVTAALPVQRFEDPFWILMVTQKGMIKRTALEEFSNPRSTGIVAIHLEEGDRLVSATLVQGEEDVLLCSRKGQAIRFSVQEVRPIGRHGKGVRAMDVDLEDRVVSLERLREGIPLLTVTERGYGKRTPLEAYRRQTRGGKGIQTIRITGRNGFAVGCLQVSDADTILLLTAQGKILRMEAQEIPIIGRHTQGVKLMEMDASDQVVSVARLPRRPESRNKSKCAGNGISYGGF